MFFSFFVTTCIAFATTFLFISLGFIFNRAFQQEKSWGLCLKIGIGYFVGLMGFVSVWRILELVLSNLRLAFGITTVLSILIVLPFALSIWPPILNRVRIQHVFMSVVVFFSLAFFKLHYFISMTKPLSVGSYSYMGTLHGGRYANLSIVMSQLNKIPIVNQNYLQSLLSTISSFFNSPTPYFSLWAWLMISSFFFVILLYGLFKQFNISSFYAGLGVFFIFFGNTALSLVHLEMVDSGSPWIHSGYTDSIVSISSFLIFIYFLKNVLGNSISSWEKLGYLGLFAVTWSMCAPQNILLAGGIVFLFTLYFGLKKSASFKPMLTTLLMAALFSAISLPLGGMLTPPHYLSYTQIPGMISPHGEQNSSSKLIQLKIGIPYTYGIAGRWYPTGSNGTVIPYYSELNYLKNEIIKGFHSFSRIDEKLLKLYIPLFWYLELTLIQTVLLCFFPLLGFFLGYLFIKKNPHLDTFNLLWKCGWISFSLGFPIVFFISVHDMKWELSRFLIPAYTLGLITLYISIYFWGIRNFKRKVVFYSLFLIVTVGSFFDVLSAAILALYFMSLPGRMTLMDFIQFLTSFSQLV